MIRFLEHNSIDFEKWDMCITQSINGLIYPYAYYLDQVTPGWAALVENDYESVMPLPVKQKWNIHYIIQPIFVQQLGIFSSKPIKAELIISFISCIPSRYKYINYNFNTFNNFSEVSNSALNPLKTYELDLIQPYQQLYKNYSTNTKRNLKKSEKEKVFVIKNTPPEPVIEAFRQNRGKEITTLTDKQYNTLKHLIYSGIHKGNAIVYSAYTEHNTFCAGIVFFHTHNKSIMIFSGNTSQAKKNGAMTALINAYIKDHSGQNIVLDFEGSNDEKLARFYSGFGSKECVYLQFVSIRFPFLFKHIAKVLISFKRYLRQNQNNN
jgi:hypothetical protein